MPFLLLLLFVLMGYIPAHSQSRLVNRWSIGVGAGWSRATTSDILLNHYNYSGNSFRNIKIKGAYINEKHQLQILFTANKSQLYPLNANLLHYEYNYIKGSLGELRLSYFYELTKKQRHFYVYAGGCNAAIFSIQRQFNRSLLYPSGLDQRKSYLISPLNMMPFVSLRYVKGKTMFNTLFGYGLVNLSVRPNDNYVKQIEVDYKQHWQLSFPDQFSSFRYSILCQYNFKKLGISLNYDLNYDKVSEFKSLRSIILAGVNILF